jgi:hypothetical protein
MNAWIARFDLPAEADGRLRVAVKDAIDIKGQTTTAGSAVVRARAKPAASDARCLAGIRASSDAIIVGKTMLTEMCISPIGNNADFGMPVSPLAPDLIPGGSSSGSAVVVASGEADVALGTDTGGSVRIPAACCGIVGLKTTWGRIPLEGVWPLAPSLDTVGPMARDVAGVVAGDAAAGTRLRTGGTTRTDHRAATDRRHRPGDRRCDRCRIGTGRDDRTRGRAAALGRLFRCAGHDHHCRAVAVASRSDRRRGDQRLHERRAACRPRPDRRRHRRRDGDSGSMARRGDRAADRGRAAGAADVEGPTTTAYGVAGVPVRERRSGSRAGTTSMVVVARTHYRGFFLA